MEYIKKCPLCNNIIYYTTQGSLRRGIKNNSTCPSCATKKGHNVIKNYKKLCPNCNSEMFYKTEKSLLNSINKNQLCMACSVKNSYKQNKKYERNCPICNKTLYYKAENSSARANRINSICTSCAGKKLHQSPQRKQQLLNQMQNNNPMKGRSIYSVWLEKYGKTIADQKRKAWKEKVAKPGKLNGMYGKPSPKGSGNGWSGYYKNVYFRSILEFNYLKYLMDNNIKFENGEKSKHKISYETVKGIFNYHPDFYLIDTQEVIEIKPKKLINTYVNKCKFKAAKEKLGDKHLILTEDDIKMLDANQLYILYINKEIIFDKKSEEKFLKYYENNKGE